MVDTNPVNCSTNGFASMRKGLTDRNSLGLRQSQSSDSGHSDDSNISTDRLKVKFEAAVQLIQNLPSKGVFQPSDEVKLRYYGLYKQATAGPNRTPKPAFYDIVAKYKWEAWKSLGDISKEVAMQTYIDELVKSIRELPKDNSGDYSELEAKLAPYLSILLDESSKEEEAKSDEEISGSNGYEDETESESEEFSDAHDPLSEQSQLQQLQGNSAAKNDIICARGETGLVPTRAVIHSSASTGNLAYAPNPVYLAGQRANVQNNRVTVGGNGNGRDGGNYRRVPAENDDTIAYALLNLQRQVDTILSRVNSMESTLNRNISISGKSFPKWWPLDISPSTAFLLMCWPFIAQYIMNRIKNRTK